MPTLCGDAKGTTSGSFMCILYARGRAHANIADTMAVGEIKHWKHEKKGNVRPHWVL